MSMATYGEAPAIYEVHAHMGDFLTKELRKRKGKMSKKTTIVGSKFSHELVLQAKYKRLGIQAKIGGSTRSWTGANGRPQTHNDRDQRQIW